MAWPCAPSDKWRQRSAVAKQYGGCGRLVGSRRSLTEREPTESVTGPGFSYGSALPLTARTLMPTSGCLPRSPGRGHRVVSVLVFESKNSSDGWPRECAQTLGRILITADLVRAAHVRRCLARQHDGMARTRVFDDERIQTRASTASGEVLGGLAARPHLVVTTCDENQFSSELLDRDGCRFDGVTASEFPTALIVLNERGHVRRRLPRSVKWHKGNGHPIVCPLAAPGGQVPGSGVSPVILRRG